MTRYIAPCPFCHNTPHVFEDDSYGGAGVTCDCDFEPGLLVEKGDLKKAIDQWNRTLCKHPRLIDISTIGDPKPKSMCVDCEEIFE